MSDYSYQQRRQFTHQPRARRGQMNHNYDDGYTSNNPRGENTFDYRNGQRRPYPAHNMTPSQHWTNVSSRQRNKRWGSHNNKPYSKRSNFESPRNSNFEMNSTPNSNFNQYQQNDISRRDNRNSGENSSHHYGRIYTETPRSWSFEINCTVDTESSQLKAYNSSRRDNSCGGNDKPHFSNFGSFHNDTSRHSEQEPYAQNKLKQTVNFSRNDLEPYSRNNCDMDGLSSDQRNYGHNSEREYSEIDFVGDPKNADDMGSISKDSEFEEKYDCSRDSRNEEKDEVLRDKKVCFSKQTDVKLYETEDSDLKLTSLQGSELYQFKRSLSDWYCVRIFQASQFPYKEALEFISEFIRPLEFCYYDFKHIEKCNEFSFLICNHEVAEKLFNCKGQIGKDNKQLNIEVSSTSPQFMPDCKMLQVIRSALARRYDPKNNSLDLSKFYDDPDLFEADCFVPLDRSDALKFVFDIIGSTLPNLKSINLDSNKLYLRDHLTIVTKSVPQLRTISLKNNKFKTAADLKSLETLNLTELFFTGNPLCKNASADTALFDLFPMFTNTSQSEEPFEFTSCETRLPPTIERVFVCSQNAKSFVRVFFKDYFRFYDSSRLDLAHLYHANAQFSLVAIDGVGKNPAVQGLIKTSRNLLRDSNHTKEEVLLFQGKPNVMKVLNNLPLTRHDSTSFTCDCPILNEQMIHVTVTGLYEQLPQVPHKKIIVYFNRAFVLIRDIAGKFKITNDQLFITNRTQEQYIGAFSSINGLNLDACFCGNELEENQIKKLSLQSGISLSVCQQYLAEAEFDYDQALDALKRALNEDLIPSEGFIVQV